MNSLISFRDCAVEIVDGRYGYTVEHSPDPEAHRAEYEQEERRLRAAVDAIYWQTLYA